MTSQSWKSVVKVALTLVATSLLAAGCGASEADSIVDPPAPEDNPFLDNGEPEGKEDTGWISALNAPEVEITMEGDVTLSSQWQARQAPVDLAQFALTNLRKNSDLYVESLLQVTESQRTIEWLIDGEWIPESDIGGFSTSDLHHFRIRNGNAIVLHPEAGEELMGKRYTAIVPTTPYRLFSDYGNVCSRGDHGELWDSDYWYTWAPDRTGCTAPTTEMTVTVDAVYDAGVTRYPEYDRLIEDGQVTAVVFFGKVSHDEGPIEEDFGYRSMMSFIGKLEQAEFVASTSPDGLRRYTKVVDGVTEQVDVSGPEDFEGLSDQRHASTFKAAVQSHEIVVYNGHSILGSSPMWSEMDLYPDGYQIYLFNGCLGYEYYVKFILEGKGSWDDVDVVSNIVETPVGPQANVIDVFIASLFDGASQGGHTSWQQTLDKVNRKTYNSYYGVSGARGNCYSPSGSLCEAVVGETYESGAAVAIPDNDPVGAESTIDVPDSLTIDGLDVHVDVTHSYVGDLQLVLAHGDTEVVLWDREGGQRADIHQSFGPTAFAGADAQGVWTLRAIDGAVEDVGTLDGWSITIAAKP